jgi:hypothetical protein
LAELKAQERRNRERLEAIGTNQPPNMTLCHIGYFELKAVKKQQVQE